MTKHSYVLFRGCSGCGDTSVHVVLTPRDYRLHRLSGVPAHKLHVLDHPIRREAKDLFFRMFSEDLCAPARAFAADQKSVAVMLPAEDIGIRREDFKLIPKDSRFLEYERIIKTVDEYLPDYKIFIKPHPMIMDFENKRSFFEGISPQVSVVDPQEPADRYLHLCDVIMELPRPASTTLFSATLQCPEKPIIAVDTQADFLGDCYKDFEGIEYISDLKVFKDILNRIANGTYTKQQLLESCQREHATESLTSLVNRLISRKRGLARTRMP